ncbi:MAG TPA: lipopolysaccharide biosynthesis protein, partial [Xanthomonadaceae bacterium]|nr:lipopolysaccharide biosynthesis protein [Xanthomonadaceae bacterium]
MLDLPGKRRSHDQPTPRGGGIAPVLVVLAGGAWLMMQDPQTTYSLALCLCGFAAVAGIGWMDDHRPLSPAIRLVVHLGAAVMAYIALCGTPETGLQVALAAL